MISLSKRIYWVASYPKSGNTWLRIFITNLRSNADGPADINRLDKAVMAHAPDRRPFDEVVGFDSEALTHDEVDHYRPELYRYMASRAKQSFFCKVHDAYTLLPDGRPLFPPDASAGVIYLIRNPLDVCVSYAHHAGTSSYDRIIDRMSNPEFELAAVTDYLDTQLRQRLGTWDDHVQGWVDAPGHRVHVMRYEDMKFRPVETFSAMAAFAGLTRDRARVERALAFSSIEELQRQEREHGFQEAVLEQRVFFRKGKVGAWRDELTSAQVERIIHNHRLVMRRFGYLNEAGEPVVDSVAFSDHGDRYLADPQPSVAAAG